MSLEIGQEVYLKDPSIFCVSLIAKVIEINNNLVTVKTAVTLKGCNTYTVTLDKLFIDEKQLKSAPNPEMGEAMNKMKQVFEKMAR